MIKLSIYSLIFYDQTNAEFIGKSINKTFLALKVIFLTSQINRQSQKIPLRKG